MGTAEEMVVERLFGDLEVASSIPGSRCVEVCVKVCTCSQGFLPGEVVVRGLLDVPGRQGQRLHVLHAVQSQHVHVVASRGLVLGDEAGLALGEEVLEDFLRAHLVVHAEEHRDPITARIFGVVKQLEGDVR